MQILEQLSIIVTILKLFEMESKDLIEPLISVINNQLISIPSIVPVNSCTRGEKLRNGEHNQVLSTI